jgi:hypothetical protein
MQPSTLSGPRPNACLLAVLVWLSRPQVATKGHQPQEDRVHDPPLETALTELNHRRPGAEGIQGEHGRAEDDRSEHHPEVAERSRGDARRHDDGDAAGQDGGEGEQRVWVG